MNRAAFSTRCLCFFSLLAPAVAPGSAAMAAPAATPAGKPASPAPTAPGAPAPVMTAPIERRLFSDSIEASSFLWNDWNRFQENYHPNYIADDDPSTGWVEGAEGSGAGEWVRIAVTPLEQTSRVRLRLRNGYQKSAGLWKANARAKEVVVKLLPGGQQVKATLADKQGWQEVTIDQPPAALRAVELDVTSVYEGTKYADLVISDVQVFATSLTRDNPSFEKSKRQSLLEWRKARMAAAKLFKAGRGGALPLYSSYRATTGELSAEASKALEGGSGLDEILRAAAVDPSFVEWREAVAVAAAIAADPGKLTRAQISPVDATVLPEVDGFDALDLGEVYEGEIQNGTLRLPMLGHVSAFFSEKLRVLDQKGSSVSQYREEAYSSRCKPAAWVKRAKASEATAPDRVVGLLVADCGEVPSREGTATVHVEQLMVFGKDGRLLLVAGDGYVDGYRWEAGGKISGGRSVQYGATVELQKGEVAAR